MKTLGIVGGIGPESTVDYYRSLIQLWRDQTKDGSAPSILLNSIDLKKWLHMLAANELTAATAYASEEMQKLARAGADVGLFASNTPHIVFGELQRRSSIPLISIVEATREAAEELGLRRLGLFGVRFTMQGRFYPDVFSKAGIALVVPNESEQAYIHDKYINELLKGMFLPGNAGAVAGDRRASCQAGAGARLDSSWHRAAVDSAGRKLQHPISGYGSDSRKGRAEAAVVLTRRTQAARVRSLPFL